MIIPQWEHACGTINPQMVVNLRVHQGNFEIHSIIISCGGCDKQHVITGLLEIEKDEVIGSQKK